MDIDVRQQRGKKGGRIAQLDLRVLQEVPVADRQLDPNGALRGKRPAIPS